MGGGGGDESGEVHEHQASEETDIRAPSVITPGESGERHNLEIFFLRDGLLVASIDGAHLAATVQVVLLVAVLSHIHERIDRDHGRHPNFSLPCLCQKERPSSSISADPFIFLGILCLSLVPPLVVCQSPLQDPLSLALLRLHYTLSMPAPR